MPAHQPNYDGKSYHRKDKFSGRTSMCRTHETDKSGGNYTTTIPHDTCATTQNASRKRMPQKRLPTMYGDVPCIRKRPNVSSSVRVKYIHLLQARGGGNGKNSSRILRRAHGKFPWRTKDKWKKKLKATSQLFLPGWTRLIPSGTTQVTAVETDPHWRTLWINAQPGTVMDRTSQVINMAK